MGNTLAKIIKRDQSQSQSRNNQPLDVNQIEMRLAMRVWKLMKQDVEEGRFHHTRIVCSGFEHINDKDTQQAVVSILNETVLKTSGLTLESVHIVVYPSCVSQEMMWCIGRTSEKPMLPAYATNKE